MFPMNTLKKSLLMAAVLFGAVTTVFADRGIGKKNKSKVKINITMPSTLRSSIGFNLKTGLMYKGSLLTTKNSILYNSTSITTYQKGNTIYIVPIKHKIAVPEMRQGYTGVKLIIKSRK